MDVAEVPLAAEENRFQAGETRGAASASAAWAVATFPLTSWNLEPFRPLGNTASKHHLANAPPGSSTTF